ncbi:MAG: phosphate/phosphite/phosphonate ABC transporter substrate-binding protein [Desulfovibrionales bacterium]
MKRVFLFLLVLPLILLAGCGQEEPVTEVDLSKRREILISPTEQAVTYAYLPQYSHSVSYERHRLLLEYLREKTGLAIRQVFPDTFEDHVRMVERGEIDISFTNPFVYIRLAKEGSRAFARIIEPSGRPDFRCRIICRADNSDIRKLSDVKGKSWIAVDPYSAGGYLFGLGYFLDHNITPGDFSEIDFSPGPGGKQEKVVLAVHAGKYDIGTIRDGTLSILRGKIDLSQIRVLAETPFYPGWVYSSRLGLDDGIVSRIAQAMFDLSMEEPEMAAILMTAGMRGIIPADDQVYDPIRQLAGKIRRMEAD